jgi:hypothetical protein
MYYFLKFGGINTPLIVVWGQESFQFHPKLIVSISLEIDRIYFMVKF